MNNNDEEIEILLTQSCEFLRLDLTRCIRESLATNNYLLLGKKAVFHCLCEHYMPFSNASHHYRLDRHVQYVHLLQRILPKYKEATPTEIVEAIINHHRQTLQSIFDSESSTTYKLRLLLSIKRELLSTS